MKNEVVIDGITYVPKCKNELAENYVIIRTYSAGVHAGELVRHEGKEVELKNTRRIWYWSGACSLSQMAVDGVKNPKDCKFSVEVPKITLTEAIEIIPCTNEAQKIIKGVPEWKN